jgi:hypothetical protein
MYWSTFVIALSSPIYTGLGKRGYIEFIVYTLEDLDMDTLVCPIYKGLGRKVIFKS